MHKIHTMGIKKGAHYIAAALLLAFLSQQALAAEEGAPQRLDPVVVTAKVLKVDTPISETPKSISLITEEELEQLAPLKFDEALRYTPGVTVQPFGSDNDTDWFRVRGFEAATYLDGNRLFRDGYYTWLLEPYGLEGIEVVKGPSSILHGDSPPGGVVNAVQKKPTSDTSGELKVQGGTNNHKAFAFDLSDAANEDGSMRFRVVGIFREEDGELDGTKNDRVYLAPSLTIDATEHTRITFLATFLNDDGIPTNPFFPQAGTILDSPNGKIDPSTNLGEPDYDRYERTQISVGYLLEHELNDVWTLSQDFSYGYNKLYLRSTYVFPNSDTSTTSVSRGVVFRDGENSSFTVDNKAAAQWDTEDMEHTALMGIDLQYHKITGDEQDSFAFAAINPYNPVYGNFTPLDPANNIDRNISKAQAGLYLQYQLKYVGKWVGMLGGRYDGVETRNKSNKNGQDEERSDGNFSLNSGVMYLADNGLSPYVSYSQSFDVLSTIDSTTGKLYKPLEGEQIEVGVKYTPDFFDGYINVALFDITQKNALVTGPTFVATQTGEVTSRGFEFEGMASLVEVLKLSLNYTYTEAKTDDTGGRGTQQAALIPKHAASAWLEYDASDVIDGLTIGNGVRYRGESKDNPASSDLTVPGVTLWDAMVSYDINENWGVQFNVNNILDTEYFSGCDYYCYYGQSRSALLSLTYNW